MHILWYQEIKKWLHYSLEIFEQFTLFSFNRFQPFIFYFFEKLQVKFRRDQTEAQIWLVPLQMVFNVSRFKPALNLNRFLADLRLGSNSLNSDSVWSNFITLKSLLFNQNQICSIFLENSNFSKRVLKELILQYCQMFHVECTLRIVITTMRVK